MGCNIESNNSNFTISGDCSNVIIGQVGQQMDNARNYDIRGNVTEDINSVSKYVKISGDIPLGKEVESVSGDIEIGGSNSGEVQSVSGDVEIMGENSGDIQTVSGGVEISSGSDGKIKTVSGDVELGGGNSGQVKTTSGKVEAGNNTGEITTISGDIKLDANLGTILTSSGEVRIGDDNIYFQRSGVNISTGGSIIGGSGNVVINGSSNGNVSVINGEVFINGIKQESGENSMQEMLVINDTQININEKVITVEGQEVSLDKAQEAGYDINNDFSEVVFHGQKIILSQDGMQITAE